MAYLYVVLQLVLWWLFHTTILFWKIVFPIHARSHERSKTTKCISIVIYTVSLLVPLIPIITIVAKFAMDVKSDPILQSRNITFGSDGLGFYMFRYPPILCSGGNTNAVYYTILLPINIAVLIGITELIFMFYSVYKVPILNLKIMCHIL